MNGFPNHKPETVINKLGNYVLVERYEPLPVCEGCFNVNEMCGTPCVNGCPAHDAWNETFDLYMMIIDGICIYKRKKPLYVCRHCGKHGTITSSDELCPTCYHIFHTLR